LSGKAKRRKPKGNGTKQIAVKQSTIERLSRCIPAGQKMTWDDITLMAVEALERDQGRGK
jgi:hypothetical protein